MKIVDRSCATLVLGAVAALIGACGSRAVPAAGEGTAADAAWDDVSNCGPSGGLQQAAPWPMFGACPTHHRRSSFTGPEAAVKKWSFATEGAVHSSPAVSSDGTIYVGSDDGRVYALRTDDGSTRWVFATRGRVRSSPAIGSDGTVYVGSCDLNVYALGPADGTKKWAFATEGEVYSSPAIGSDGTIYIGSHDGKVYALNPTDGSKKWA